MDAKTEFLAGFGKTSEFVRNLPSWKQTVWEVPTTSKPIDSSLYKGNIGLNSQTAHPRIISKNK